MYDLFILYRARKYSQRTYLIHFHNYLLLLVLLLLLLLNHGSLLRIDAGPVICREAVLRPCAIARAAPGTQAAHCAAVRWIHAVDAEQGALDVILHVGLRHGLAPQVVDAGELHKGGEHECSADAHPDVNGLQFEKTGANKMNYYELKTENYVFKNHHL